MNNVSFNRKDPVVRKLLDAKYWIFDHPLDPESVLAAMPVPYDDVEFDNVGGHMINRETAVSQLERYRMLNANYVDQNTSITVSYEPREKKSLVDWFDKHWDEYVACSFLFRQDIDFAERVTDADSYWKFQCATANKRSFAYIPQLAVSHEDYENYVGRLGEIDIDQAGSMDTELEEECKGGACPVR